MDKFMTDIATPYWWLSAVLAAIVVNLVAAAIWKPIDKWWATTSTKRAAEKVKRDERFAARVDFYLEHPELHIFVVQAAVNGRIVVAIAVVLWCAATILTLLGSQLGGNHKTLWLLFGVGSSSVFMVAAMMAETRIRRMSQAVEDGLRKRIFVARREKASLTKATDA